MKAPDIPKSGKCGHIVWQDGPHGQVCHPLVTPTNPRTPAQVNGREIWRAVNARWNQLTQDQRSIWIAVAQTVKSKGRLGQGKLTGKLLFVKINYPLAYLGRDQFDLPPPYPWFPEPAVTSLSVSNLASVIGISLGCSGDPGDCTILRASIPLSAGREVCTDFRIIGTCPPPVEKSADITALYTAKFGVPPIGSKLFLRANHIIDGWEDEPHEFTAIVPPPT